MQVRQLRAVFDQGNVTGELLLINSSHAIHYSAREEWLRVQKYDSGLSHKHVNADGAMTTN
jgi:hypothetical protein